MPKDRVGELETLVHETVDALSDGNPQSVGTAAERLDTATDDLPDLVAVLLALRGAIRGRVRPFDRAAADALEEELGAVEELIERGDERAANERLGPLLGRIVEVIPATGFSCVNGHPVAGGDRQTRANAAEVQTMLVRLETIRQVSPEARAARSAVATRETRLGAIPASFSQGPAVDVNDADVDELSLLPGVGKSLAQEIVTYRMRHGPFRDEEALLDVFGSDALDRFRVAALFSVSRPRALELIARYDQRDSRMEPSLWDRSRAGAVRAWRWLIGGPRIL